jgi:hypothetical protein
MVVVIIGMKVKSVRGKGKTDAPDGSRQPDTGASEIPQGPAQGQDSCNYSACAPCETPSASSSHFTPRKTHK